MTTTPHPTPAELAAAAVHAEEEALAALQALETAEGLAPIEDGPAVPDSPLVLALIEAARQGQVLVLQGAELEELADLARFGAFARDQLYPTVVAVAPLVQRIGQLGAQLQTAGPLELIALLTSQG